MTTIPREFRCEVKVGARSAPELSTILRRLADHVDTITEDLEKLKMTGVAGPDGSEIRLVKSPIETVTELGGGEEE